MKLNALSGFFSAMGQRVAALPGLRNPKVRRVLGWVIAVLLLVLLLWGISALWGSMRVSTRQLLVIALLVLALTLWLWIGMPWLERRRIALGAPTDLRSGGGSEEIQARQFMSDSMATAKGLIKRSPDMTRAGDLMYRIPWYLMLGESSAPAAQVLDGAARSSNVEPPAAPVNAADGWRWWFFNGLVAIECNSAFVCDPSDKSACGTWYQALDLLRVNPDRRRMPLNGIVLSIAVTTLLGDEDQLKRQLRNMRRLVDECMFHLQIVLPVYVVVTAAESTPGYADYLSYMPKEAKQQALGYRVDWNQGVAPAGGTGWSAAFSVLRSEFARVRLGGIRAESDAGRRKGIWDFTQCILTALTNLEKYMGTLLEANARQRIPQIRGLYVAMQGRDSAFLHDLFNRFLPGDQPLAQRTRNPGLWRWLGAGISTGLALLLAGMIVRQVTLAWEDQSALLARVKVACQGTDAGDADMVTLAVCSRDLKRIEDDQRNARLTWGMAQYEEQLLKKKRHIVKEFEALLERYDRNLESDINGATAGVEHSLSVAQRARFVERCLDSMEQCRIDPQEPVLMFDPDGKLYRSVADYTSGDLAKKAMESQSLAELYMGFLRWKGEVSSQDDFLARERGRVEKWLKGLRFAVNTDELERWAAERTTVRPPLSLQRVWGTGQPIDGPMVSAAYTRSVWAGVVRPVLHQMERAGAEKGEIERSAKAYFERYFLAWRDYVAKFDRGIPAVTGRNTDTGLLERVGTDGTPYGVLRKEMDENLFHLPLRVDYSAHVAMWWDGVRHDWTAFFSVTWRLIRRVNAQIWGKDLIPAPLWLQAQLHIQEAGWRNVDGRLKPYYVLIQNDRKGDASLKLLRDIYGKTGEDAEKIAAVAKIAERAYGRYPVDPADDGALRSNIGELRLLLGMLGRRGGDWIDSQWKNKVMVDMKSLLKANPNASVGGLLKPFCEQQMKNLVDCGSGARAEMYGAVAPVSVWALDRLGQGAAAAGAPPTPMKLATIGITGPSTFGKLPEGKKGTSVEVICTSQHHVSSKAETLLDQQVTITDLPDACTSVRIRVAIPEPATESGGAKSQAPVTQEPQGPTQVVTEYKGRNVLAALAEEFKSGSRQISIASVQGNYPRDQWALLERQLRGLGVTAVRVNLSVQISEEARARMSQALSPGGIPSSLME